MAVREILKMGDSRLLRQAKPVLQTDFGSQALRDLVKDMLETMQAADGAGLAAPQIGVDLQLVIFGSDSVNPRYPNAPMIPRTILCNPVLTPLGTEENDDWEGCLSVPSLRAIVPRWTHLHYAGFDENGNPIEKTVSDFHARVVQHECDHLNGVLYPARIRDFTRFGFTDSLVY